MEDVRMPWWWCSCCSWGWTCSQSGRDCSNSPFHCWPTLLATADGEIAVARMRNDCKAAGFSYILLDPRLENSATAVLAFLSQNLIHIIFGGCYFSRLEGLAASTGVWTLGRMISSGSLPNNQELVFTPRVCHRSDPSAHNCHGIICFAVSTTWVIILQVAATVWAVVCDSTVWPPVIVILPYTDPKSLS